MIKQFFFDSHGGLHVSCGAEEPGAGAFGPTGISRRVKESERIALRGYLSGFHDYTASDYVALRRHVVFEGGWEILPVALTGPAFTWAAATRAPCEPV
jgi:hypothetical protein